MKILLTITNNTQTRFMFKKLFNEIAFYLCSKMKCNNLTVIIDVLITNNQEIQQISKEFRNIDHFTDVLSFPLKDDNLVKQTKYLNLGQIVLSREKIIAQAKEFNHSIKREFCYLFTHGLIHLFGNDHKKPEDEKKFNSIAYDVMEKLKISR